jgi:hypothetical protein
MRRVEMMACLWILAVACRMGTAGTNDPSIRAGEHEALVEWYHATGGEQWKRSGGWLGPPGSECHWYGVTCGVYFNGEHQGQVGVVALNLQNNGLVGKVSSVTAPLPGLEKLLLDGNNIQGPLAPALVARWDQGLLEITPASLLHDVKRIVFRDGNPSLACGDSTTILESDGMAHRVTLDCGGTVVQHVPTCRSSDGRILEFDSLARLSEDSGLFQRDHETRTPGWFDAERVTITIVTEAGSRTTVWDLPAKKSLREWEFLSAVRGVLSRVNWQPSGSEGCAGDEVP